MAKLKLGPVLEDKPVKIAIELPGPVHRDLVAYARIHAEETGQAVAPDRLVPAMLAQFMASDRGFTKTRREESGGG
jgi:hypothetical protein